MHPQPVQPWPLPCGCCGSHVILRGLRVFSLWGVLFSGVQPSVPSSLLAHSISVIVWLSCCLWIRGPLVLKHCAGISSLGVNTHLLKSILCFYNDHSWDSTKLAIPLGCEPNSLRASELARHCASGEIILARLAS